MPGNWGKVGTRTCHRILAACSPDLYGPGHGCPESMKPRAARHPFPENLAPKHN
jgi:hypothetical protein